MVPNRSVYTQSKKKCTMDSLACPVTQGQGPVTSAGSYHVIRTWLKWFLTIGPLIYILPIKNVNSKKSLSYVEECIYFFEVSLDCLSLSPKVFRLPLPQMALPQLYLTYSIPILSGFRHSFSLSCLSYFKFWFLDKSCNDVDLSIHI